MLSKREDLFGPANFTTRFGGEKTVVDCTCYVTF